MRQAWRWTTLRRGKLQQPGAENFRKDHASIEGRRCCSQTRGAFGTTKSDEPLSHDDSDERSDDDDDSDDESANSLYHDVAVEQPPRQTRPLIASEINANYEIASSDCNHGADPIEFTDRRVPADVALNVFVTVKHGAPKRELPTCATINEVSRLFSFTEDQPRIPILHTFSVCTLGGLLEQ